MGLGAYVEVPLFLVFFGFLLTDSLKQNLLIYRTCYVILGLDKGNCSLLGNTNNNITRELEKLVQPQANMISMVESSVDSVSAALLCLLFGAWSDRFGRKPVIVVNLIGYTAMMLVMVVFSAIETASPWFMLTSSVPVILTGGASLFGVMLAYLSDVTDNQNRGFRMGVFEVVLAMAVLLGSSSSPYVFNATGYVVVFMLGALSSFLALLYTIFFMPESLKNRQTEKKIMGLFDIQNISGIFKTTFRKRPQYNRAVILLMLFALALYLVVKAGDGSVMFLFVRAKFHWTFKLYTWLNNVTNLVWISGIILIVYIVHHKLKVNEAFLIFVGFISMMVGTIILGLAQVDWLIYVAAVVEIPSSSISPMTRSLISKSVNPDEIAKIFSVFTIMQKLLGLVSSPVYTLLYNATLNTDPGIFNFVTAGGHAINALVFLVVLMLQKRSIPEDHSGTDETNSHKPEDGTNDSEELLAER